MREIKMRAWDPVQKKMLKPSYLEFIDGNAYWVEAGIDGDQQSGNDGPIASPVTLPVIKVGMILEQSTGLKDFYGVQIYEGDIVELDERDYGEDGVPDDKYHIGKISWESGGFTFIADESKDNFSNFPLQIASEDDFRVIGNVHQNPELLEVEK